MATTMKTDYKKLYDRIVTQAARTDLPTIQKERYEYMLQKFNELTASGVDFNTAVRKAYSSANIKYAMQRGKQAQAAGDTGKVSFFKKMRGHALARTQAGQEIYTDIRDRGSAGGGRTGPSVRTIIGKAATGPRVKFIQLLIFIIAAALSLIIPPIFGIPPRQFLAIGFVFIAIYSVFPSEHKILSELESGETVGGAGLGFLMAKACAKLIAFIFILIDFFSLNRTLALIFGFLFYFNLPFHYKSNQPYKAILAWVRLALGVFLTFIIFQTFGGPLSLPLGLMAAAFFIAIPTHISAEEGSAIRINVNLGGRTKTSLEMFEKTIFTLVMAFALFSFLGTLGGWGNINFADINMLLFVSVWAFSVVTGWIAGPEGRPAVGVIVIMVALFIFSTTYTGYIGEAIFGVWWPQVYATIETAMTYLSPLTDAWSEAQSSLTDTWDILTNPMAYYARMAEKQKASTSKVKTGGTKKSIEVTRFEFDTKILDPACIPLLGYIDIENQGEFESDFVTAGLSAYWTNASMVGTAPGLSTSKVGIFDIIYCSDDGVNTTRVSGSHAQCDWNTTMYSKQTKSLSFKMKRDLSDCSNIPTQSCPGFPWCTVDFPVVSGIDLNVDLAEINATASPWYYIHGGQNVIFKANFTYNYNVNVSIPIQIINEGLYERMVQARQMMLAVVESQYTGGPAKATISTKIQPIVTGLQSLITFYIYNEGEGNITNVTNFTIIVPQRLGSGASIPIEASSFTSCENNALSLSTDGKNYITTCVYDPGRSPATNPELYPPITRGNYRKVSFFAIPDEITDQITTLIVAIASYEYTKEKTANLQIATYPYQ